MWSPLSHIRFESAWFLVVFVPLFFVFFWRRRYPGPTVLYSSLDLVAGLPRTFRQRLQRSLPWVQLLAFTLMIVAVARPQAADEKTRIRTEGIAIQMCIDHSGSMQAMDFPIDGERVDRLTAVKKVLQQFIAGDGHFRGRPNDLIGLISFGGFATALCPPTLDHDAVLSVLETVKIPAAIRDENGRVINERLLQQEQATAIGDALALGVERVKNIAAKSRIVILLSDGENTAGVIDPEDAIAAAEQFGIKVYTIGIGSDGMAPFPTVDVFGDKVLRMESVTLDEKTLRKIADVTGGKYFNAKDVDSLAKVYEEIDQLERTEIEGSVYRNYKELYGWILAIGLSVWVTAIVLNETWLKTIP
ncbi:MAG: VWA domain-containing protein [Fuerstiella sp.]